MDVSGELLAQAMDGEFTKGAHESAGARDPITAMLKDPESSIVFYGIVRLPNWFKFDEDRMFCDPANSRKLLKRNDVLTAIGKKGFGVTKYYKVNKDTRYSRLRDSIGAKFDVVAKAGMKVVGTVKNAKEFSTVKGKVQFACKHLPKTTKKYRVYLGHPDVTPVIGATVSEHRTLSFREAVLFDSTEEARAHMESLFEEGILNETMGKGFKAWTEEQHLSSDSLADDNNLAVFNKLSHTMNELFGVDFCAVDVVVSNGKPVITNMTACPSLQADGVLAFVSEYFKKITEEGRKVTPEHIKKLVEGCAPEQLDVVAKLLKKALAA
jgi:hypothetical protein